MIFIVFLSESIFNFKMFYFGSWMIAKISSLKSCWVGGEGNLHIFSSQENIYKPTLTNTNTQPLSKPHKSSKQYCIQVIMQVWRVHFHLVGMVARDNIQGQCGQNGWWS